MIIITGLGLPSRPADRSPGCQTIQHPFLQQGGLSFSFSNLVNALDIANDNGPSSSSGAGAAALMAASNIQAIDPNSKGRRHIVCTSTFQMCVLLLFNLRDKLTYEEIKEETSIPDSYQIRVERGSRDRG